MIEIDKMIKEAMISKSPELAVYKEIKAKFLVYEKSPEGVKNPLNEAKQLELIKKIKAEHEETRSFISNMGSQKYTDETFYIKTLDRLLPRPGTVEDVEAFVEYELSAAGESRPQMGSLIKKVKEKFPSNDGKMIADIVKKNY